MAIYKFSNAGGFGAYTRYNDFLAGNPAVILDKGSMYPLGVVTLASNQTVITFENIPQTYTHLQLRVMARSSVSDWANIKFNNDGTSGNYRWHYLTGTGTAASSSSNTGNSLGVLSFLGNSSNPSNAVIDILDYKSTNKNKTVRCLGGYDGNGNGQVSLISNMYFPGTIAAITRIDLQLGASGSFQTNSSFALYGIQA